MATALAYVVTADMRRPYFVYIGLQDNGRGAARARRGRDLAFGSDWFRVGGGDGFYTAVGSDGLYGRVLGVAERQHESLRSARRT